MFTNKDKAKYDSIMDSIENMGECLGLKVHRGGSKIIRYIVIGSLVLFFGVIVFMGSLIKRAVGGKK